MIENDSRLIAERFCSDISSIIKEAQIFKNCLTPFPKLIVGIIGRQIKKLSKQICSNKQRRLGKFTVTRYGPSDAC